jgi:hypothetical protein
MQHSKHILYKGVDVKGIETVLSEAYLMARTRISYFVRVDYEGEGTFLARISKYLKVGKRNEDGSESVLRLAIADLFKTEIKFDYQGHLNVVKGQHLHPYRKNYPMAVGHIAHKLVFFTATTSTRFRLNRRCSPAYSNNYVKRSVELEQNVQGTVV